MEHSHTIQDASLMQEKGLLRDKAQKPEITKLMLKAKLPSESRADLLLQKDTKGRIHSNLPLNWKAG